MVTTTGTAPTVFTVCPPRSAPPRNVAPGSGSRRLVSLVAAVGDYVRGRSARGRSVPPGAGIAHLDCGDLDDLTSAPGGPSVWPGRADKPTTVAHYQAMADQVAEERRLAALDARLADHEPHAGVPRELWITPRTPFDRGVRHDG